MFKALARRRWPALAAAFVAALAAAGLGAVAYASIPDAGGVIHGCYKSSGGDLRVVDDSTASCKNGETPLDWSQTGPQGAQGRQGPQGPEGAGHAYYATSNGQVTVHGGTTIMSLTGLPAGKYLVWSPVIVVGDGDDGTNDVCDWIVNGSTIVIPEGYTFMFDAKDDGFGRAAMSGLVTLSSHDSTIAVNCDTNTDGATATGRITALKVGSVN